jgi:hypothetical protein
MASVVVEEVISKYILDASKFESGMSKVLAAAQKGKTIASSFGEGISKVGGFLKNTAVGAGLAALPIIGLGVTAINAAADFDTLSRSLTGMTRDAKRTAEILAFVDQMSIPSIFTSAELGKAAALLQAYGLQVEQFLPVADAMATGMGMTAEGVDIVIRALGKLKSGSFGEGFQALRDAFGVSNEELAKFGATFSKTNEFTGSIETALESVRLLAIEKFGGIAKEMAGGPAAAMASLMDNINRSMRQIGQTLLPLLLPMIEKITKAFETMVKTGAFEKMVNGLINLIGMDKIATQLYDTFISMSVVVVNLPRILDGVRRTMVTSFNEIRQTIINTVAVLGGLLFSTAVFVGFARIVKAIQAVSAAFKELAISEAILEAIATKGKSLVPAALSISAGLAMALALQKGLDAIIPQVALGDGTGETFNLGEETKKFRDQLEKSGGVATQTTNFSSALDQVIGNLENKQKGGGALQNIATNTKATAENTQKLADIQDQILGGGSLGSRGLSRQELSDIQTGRGASGTREIKTILVELGVAIERGMSRTAARAIGNNVSRREV